MISDDLLSILVCPETRQGLRLLLKEELDDINRKIEAGTLKTRGGADILKPLSSALVRDDGLVAYQVSDNIPVLLIEESFLLVGVS